MARITKEYSETGLLEVVEDVIVPGKEADILADIVNDYVARKRVDASNALARVTAGREDILVARNMELELRDLKKFHDYIVPVLRGERKVR